MTASRLTPHRAADAVSREVWAAALVALVAVVALLSGAILRSSVEGRTSVVAQGGVTSDVPSGWLVDSGGGDLAFVAIDPRDLDTRYSGVLVASTQEELSVVAQRYTEAKGSLREGFRVLEAAPVGGLDGEAYRVRYAFVSGDASIRIVYGEDVLRRDGVNVLALTYEAPSDVFLRTLHRFERLVSSARVEAGP